MKRARAEAKRPLLHSAEPQRPKKDLAVSWSNAKGYAAVAGERQGCD